MIANASGQKWKNGAQWSLFELLILSISWHVAKKSDGAILPWGDHFPPAQLAREPKDILN